MDVSIIIVNYNTNNLLKDCIYSINEKTVGLDYEIIVVDNNSIEKPDLMLNSNFPNVIYIQSGDNIGFGRANNLGVKYAKGKYLFFLNSDTILVNNPIKILFDFMEEETSYNIGVCGGNLFTKDMQPNYSYSLTYPSLKQLFLYKTTLFKLLKQETFNNHNVSKDVAIIVGADLFIRSDVFKLVNGFDENYFMYVEETDLQFRIMKEGYKMVSNPIAKIIHYQGVSSTNFFKLKNEYLGYKIFFSKFKSKIQFSLYRFLEIILSILKIMYFLISNRNNKAKDYYQYIIFIFKN